MNLCLDIDECALITDNCIAHATCRNTEGSFICFCKNGFVGNGTSCAGKDNIPECTVTLYFLRFDSFFFILEQHLKKNSKLSFLIWRLLDLPGLKRMEQTPVNNTIRYLECSKITKMVHTVEDSPRLSLVVLFSFVPHKLRTNNNAEKAV